MRRKALLFFACSLLGAALVFFFLGPVAYKLGAFRFALRVLPGLGRTRLELPPVGAVEAGTHLGIWDFEVTLQSVDLDRLQSLLATAGTRQDVLTALREGGKQILAHFFFRGLVLAAAGGLWGASWLRCSWRDRGKGALVGAGALILVAATTAATFDLQAFQNPTYSGVLKGAPWMLRLAQESWQRLDRLNSDVKFWTQSLRQVLERANAMTPLEDLQDDLKVLHASDVHNNPLGLNFIAQIRDHFSPDLIVNTGDLTDFGTPLEKGLLVRLSSLQVPHYLVLGNHDSPVVAEEVRKVTGIHLLDGWVEVGGLSLLGRSDPVSISADIRPASADEVLAQVADLSAVIHEKGKVPFFLVAHDPRVGDSFVGLIPVILVGHTHQAKVEAREGSVVVNAGTTGGAGVRGLLQGREEVPLTAALLYVDTKAATPELEAVDIIRLYPQEGRFELARRTLRAGLRRD